MKERKRLSELMIRVNALSLELEEKREIRLALLNAKKELFTLTHLFPREPE